MLRYARRTAWSAAALPARLRPASAGRRLWMRRGSVPVVLHVLVEYVDLPEQLIRIRDPEFRLERIAALHTVLAPRFEARGLETMLNLHELVGGPDPDADVIQVSAMYRPPRHQREHDRRLVQLEFRVVAVGLCRFDAEQLLVERDRSCQVRHVQRGVELAHGLLHANAPARLNRNDRRAHTAS